MKKPQPESHEAQDLKSEIQALERGIACFKIIETTLNTKTIDELENQKEALEEQLGEMHDDLAFQDEERTDPLWQFLHDQIVKNLQVAEPYGIESDEHQSRWEELRDTADNSLLSSQWDDILEDEIGSVFYRLSLREKLALKLSTKDGISSLEWWKECPNEASLDIEIIEKHIDDKGVISKLKSMVVASVQNEHHESQG